MKYIFEEEPLKVFPLAGEFKTGTVGANITYSINNNTTFQDVVLAINNQTFEASDLSELIDFLTSVKEHLETK